MNMNCKKAEEYLVDYLYQELPAKKTLEIEKHLHSCAHCAKTLESWRAIHRAYQRSTEEPQIAPYTKQKILAIAEEELLRSPSWKERFVLALKIATVPIALFVLVLFLNSEKKADIAMQKAKPESAAPLRQTEAAREPKAEQVITGGRKQDLSEYEPKRKAQESLYRDELSARPKKEERTDKDLKALGYVASEEAPAPSAPATAAPREVVPESDDDYQQEELEERTAATSKAAGISKTSKNANEPFQEAQEKLRSKDVRGAQRLLDEAVAIDTVSERSLPDQLYQNANQAQQRGEYADAILQLEQVQNYRDYKNRDDALLRLGDLYSEVGEFDKAVKTYSQISGGQRKVAIERIQRLQKKQEAQQQLKSLEKE